MHYTMGVQWSEADQCFVVFLPDFAELVMQPCEGGATHEEAARRGQEVIESLIKLLTKEGKSLPQPKTFPEKPLQVA